MTQAIRRLQALAAVNDIPKKEDLPNLDNKQLLSVYTKMTKWLKAKKVDMAYCKAVIAECQKRGI